MFISITTALQQWEKWSVCALLHSSTPCNTCSQLFQGNLRSVSQVFVMCLWTSVVTWYYWWLNSASAALLPSIWHCYFHCLCWAWLRLSLSYTSSGVLQLLRLQSVILWYSQDYLVLLLVLHSIISLLCYSFSGNNCFSIFKK